MLKQEISKLIKDKSPKSFGLIFRTKKDLLEKIIRATNFLSEDSSLSERLYVILYGTSICKHCKLKKSRFISFNKGYAPYCSIKCANSDERKKKKTEETWIKKYGSLEARKIHLKEATKATFIKRYGYASNFHNSNFQKNNSLKAHSKKATEKRKKTNKERYGTEFTFQSEIIKRKIKRKFVENYGCHPSQSDKVKRKIKETVKKRYGVDNVSQLKAIVEKRENTCMQRYGVSNPSQRHIKNLDLWNNSSFIKENFINSDGTIRYREMMSFFGINNLTNIRCHLNRIGIPYKPYRGHSRFEVEIKDFLESIGIDKIELNVRNVIPPFEIDVYVPEKKIGIEFHSMIWHSFGYHPNNAYMEGKLKSRLWEKANKASQKGILLLQIFENEWNNPNKQKIWESVISSKFGLFKKKIYARNCNIIKLSQKEANNFYYDNHLQGGIVGGNLHIGLLFKNMLVACMSFGKSRFGNQDTIELLRYCNLKYISVVGGFSKLLKHNGNCKIISFANRRWSNGSVYEINNFKLLSITKPNFWVFHQDDIYSLKHRISFQRYKLKKLLPNFNSNLSTSENLYIHGYRRIYDAGNLKYLFL